MAIRVPPEEQEPCHRCCIQTLFAAFVLGLIAMIVLVCIYAPKKPQYYAAIDAVSGLDPALDQIEFKLTLAVTSRNPFSSECLEPGAGVAVAYQPLGVQVANGTTAGQACAAGWHPEQMVRMAVVARGAGRARLPGSVLDGVAADVRRGVALLDVSLRIPATRADDEKLVVCRGRRVGGVVEALLTPCEETKSS